MGSIQRGFTLLEMAITLAIAGILLTGLIMTLSAQQDASREAETRRFLVQAREALYGFAMANGRLPCPATATLASGAANAGVAANPTDLGCTGGPGALVGALPWATLGLAETDAYGNRVTYRVDATFARTVIGRAANEYSCAPDPDPTVLPTQSAFALCSKGAINVANLGGAGAPLATNLPAVLVAHGPNGAGAFNTSGTQQPAGGADEAENSDGDTQFRAGSRREAGAPGGAFDDEVEWIVPAILIHRMVQAGRLP